MGGEGARLHLADGRSILDFGSPAECSHLGHQHPRVAAAIRFVSDRTTRTSLAPWPQMPSTVRALLDELLERFFSPSFSE